MFEKILSTIIYFYKEYHYEIKKDPYSVAEEGRQVSNNSNNSNNGNNGNNG